MCLQGACVGMCEKDGEESGVTPGVGRDNPLLSRDYRRQDWYWFQQEREESGE